MMTEAKTPSDAVSAEELAVRAREGSRGSFDELVVRLRPRLVAFLARRLADPPGAAAAGVPLAGVVSRFRPRLLAFLPRRLADPAEAEDVAQETFLRAYDHLDRY